MRHLSSPSRQLCMAVPALLVAMPASAQSQAPELGGSLLQLALGLAVVLALLIGSLFLLKRLTSRGTEAGGLLKVVAGTAVGARERVVVVEVGSTWLVLGVAPGRVSALAEVPRQALPPAPTVAGGDFAGWLKRTMERR